MNEATVPATASQSALQAFIISIISKKHPRRVGREGDSSFVGTTRLFGLIRYSRRVQVLHKSLTNRMLHVTSLPHTALCD